MEPDRGTGALLSDIRTVAETGSTNADMLALAATGAGEGLWLRAARQSAGRGRLGRDWVSPVGNLHASTLVRLRPGDPPAPTLALVAAVALEETVSTYLLSREGGSPDRRPELSPRLRGGVVMLKWPNDLLIDGAKLSGILLERAGDAVVVGIGVNLAHHPDLPDRPTTSLAEHRVEVAPDAFLDTLADAMSRWVACWRGGGFAVIRALWLERAHPIGTALSVRLPDGGAIDGLFDGLDEDGALLLRLAGGERRVIHAADVFLI